MMKLYTPGKQRGIGLLELMLSLAIIAILLVMATRYYIITSRSQQVNQTAGLVGVLQGGIANWKAGKATYTPTNAPALSGAVLESMGLVPGPNWDGSKVVNRWGNEVTITGTGATATIIMDLPNWACTSVADKLGAGATCATKKLTYEIKAQDTTQQ